MFRKAVYVARRKCLKKQIGSGLILFLGNEESAMNYPANPYPFRQDSHFLYFFGLNSPGLAALIDVDENREIVFGNDLDLDDIIWMGPQPTLAERCRPVGITETMPMEKLAEYCRTALASKRLVHFLPPYRPDRAFRLQQLLGIHHSATKEYASESLIRAVVAQRARKSAEEVEQIEAALDVTALMYQQAMAMARPGLLEMEIAGTMEGVALSRGCRLAFPAIVTVNGQTLHNHFHGNRMRAGHLLLMDCGCESPLGYAADITRTIPVSGKFSDRQRDIYEIVLRVQREAIQAIKPGVRYRDVHLLASRVMAEGLRQVNLLKGDPAEAVSQGAHALFFPHGLGHLMGLDVHDLEDVGENWVGYDGTVARSQQFGLAALRLARKLQPGFVLTVEPGIYFIPALIDQWRGQNKLKQFINYPEVEKYLDFGGIRIEDDVLVSDRGRRVLGRPIAKDVNAIEKQSRPAR